jgi:K+-sensing histidine kinase KdpD
MWRRQQRGDLDDRGLIVGYAIGGLGPIALAAVLVPVRDDIQHATAMLLLVVVVVLAAMTGGQGAGAVGAVSATLSYDFFLTRPYLSLGIERDADVENALVLLIIGSLVGQLLAVARRRRRSEERAARDVQSLVRIAERAAAGEEPAAIVRAVEDELVQVLQLFRAAYTTDLEEDLPVLERSGVVRTTEHRLNERGEPTLPLGGVDLPVTANGRTIGHVILHPRPDAGAPLRSRVIAVALADQLGAALAARGPGPPAR